MRAHMHTQRQHLYCGGPRSTLDLMCEKWTMVCNRAMRSSGATDRCDRHVDRHVTKWNESLMVWLMLIGPGMMLERVSLKCWHLGLV